MNSVCGRGQLRHHFHGTYWASIVLVFDTPTHASDAFMVLREGWVQSAIERQALFWTGETEALQKAKKQLATFGADPSKIDSIAHSIDFGELFEVVIPVVPVEQGRLFALEDP